MLKAGVKAFQMARGLKKLKKCGNERGEVLAAKYLTQILENERGLFFKLAQYMGTNPSSSEQLKELSQRSSDTVDLDQVKNKIEESYHKKWDELFLSIDKKAFCASLGQVHRAVLLDGSEVAIKLQYPGIREEIEQQLKLFKLLPLANNLGPLKKWGIPIDEYRQMIRDVFDQELDYLSEIKNQLAFKENNKDYPWVVTSDILPQYKSSTIYLQSYLKGDNISQVAAKWSDTEKRLLGKRLLESFLINFFYHGFIQGDSNHGNFLFNRQEDSVEICFLDFGNCATFSEKFRFALLKLIEITAQETDEDPLPYLIEMGFDPKKLTHIHCSLPLLCKSLLAPFLAPYAYKISEWQLEKEIELILGETKWWFRSSGSTEFFALIKAFLGVKNLIQKLEVPIFWSGILKQVAAPLSDSLKDYAVTSYSKESYTFNSIAKKLRISVTKEGIEKVNLTFPIATLLDLEDYIENDIAEQLEKRQISLKSLVQDSLQKGCLPGSIFDLKEETPSKRYHVWLE
ncbi:MAG: hypothetical protein HN509_16865 [Halobacteriovoraceae bacterium]|jgi:predicted unusual protein kinase regulating ubiquinone biosynthesis (AarF/ABC1/UbiB family)|nr:hypothetical protein [Halobacteriovoraceae bacterium]MBT5094838.1 hypothetical protein [Halobacteriovoraceae bacterium]